MKIGVFDSGLGGELVAKELRRILPEHDYIVVNDRAHVPYGSRSDAEIIDLTHHAIAPLFDAGCEIIVIACNTATTVAIDSLRHNFPQIDFIGIEPMIKTADLASNTRRVTVLATPTTLQSLRYHHLKQQYGSSLVFDEPQTDNWASVIEFGDPKTIDFGDVEKSIAHGSDTIVLACTHYLALTEQLHRAFDHVQILEPTKAISKQVARLVAARQAE